MGSNKNNIISKRDFVLALSHEINLQYTTELQLAGNPFHDALGRFSSSTSKLTKRSTKAIKKFVKNTALDIEAQAQGYYGFSPKDIIEHTIHKTLHHVRKVRKIKPAHIKEYSQKVVNKLHVKKSSGKKK